MILSKIKAIMNFRASSLWLFKKHGNEYDLNLTCAFYFNSCPMSFITPCSCKLIGVFAANYLVIASSRTIWPRVTIITSSNSDSIFWKSYSIIISFRSYMEKNEKNDGKFGHRMLMSHIIERNVLNIFKNLIFLKINIIY